MAKLPVPISTPKLPDTIFTAASQGATAAAANAQLADKAVQFGAALEQRRTQREISQMNAEFAKAQAELTVQWQETLRTADPNDPEVASRFRNEVVQPRIESLQDFANTSEGKAYYQRASAGLGAGFLVTTEAGQASLEETAAVQNWEVSLNQMGDAVAADPASFDSTLAMIDIQVEGLVQANGLSREKALVLQTEARTQTALNAATGLIRQNPEQAKVMIESGLYSEYISGSQKNTLLGMADTQLRAQEAARKAALEEAAERSQVAIMKAAINEDGSINAAALPGLQGEILRDPTLAQDPAALRATINFLDQLVEDENSGNPAKTDPAVFDGFMARAALPPGDPRRPRREEVLMRVGDGLSKDDARFIINDMIGEKGSDREVVGNDLRNDSMRNARTILTGSANLEFVEDPGKVLNYNRFQHFARVMEVKLRDDGLSPTEIWAPDGPIMGQLNRFNKRLSLDEQNEIMATALSGGPDLGPEPVITSDPLRFDTGRNRVNAGALRDGPTPTTVFGKPIKDATVSDMDRWLKEN